MRKKPSKKEMILAVLKAEEEYWSEILFYITDWSILGWSGLSSVTYRTGNSALRLTGGQYEKIINAIRE